MKTTLSLGLMFAAASLSFACSDEEGNPRGQGGGGNTTGNTGGTGNAGMGGSAQGGSSGAGQGGGGGSMRNYGDALTIGADGSISGMAAGTAIDGAAYIVASAMNPANNQDFRAGALCMNGATAQVTGTPPDYDNYWGAEIDIDLLRGPIASAAVIGDAGNADAGDAGPAIETEAKPWDPGNILGFSFKIEGPTVAPALSVKAGPTNGDPSTDNFCYRGVVPTSGQVIDVLFTDIRRDCWANPPESASLFQDPEGFSELNNFGWQINASEMMAYMFDFCISEIRPIIP